MPFGILACGLLGSGSALRFLSVLRQCTADTCRLCPGRDLDFMPANLSGSADRPIMAGPRKREKMVPWLRGLLLRHWRLHSDAPPPPAFALVAAHSLKCTLLAWASKSVGLYSRDDVVPMLRLQRQIVTSVRSGFRPLQPVARGLDDPLPDFPVSLPSPSSVPDHFLLSPDCLPEVSAPGSGTAGILSPCLH